MWWVKPGHLDESVDKINYTATFIIFLMIAQKCIQKAPTQQTHLRGQVQCLEMAVEMPCRQPSISCHSKKAEPFIMHNFNPEYTLKEGVL